MMPLKRILMEKRFLALPLLLGLREYFRLHFGCVSLGVKSAGARERADAAAVALKAAEQESTAARELVAGKARADEELVTFYDKVVPANLAGGASNHIRAAAGIGAPLERPLRGGDVRHRARHQAITA